MASSTSPSTTNRSNSANSVNINVGTSTSPQTPFTNYHGGDTSGNLTYNPPSLIDQFIASVLAFKDDFPNFVRKLGYVLIICMVLTQIASSCYNYYLMSSLEKRVEEIEKTANDSYNAQRDILDAINAYNSFTLKR